MFCFQIALQPLPYYCGQVIALNIKQVFPFYAGKTCLIAQHAADKDCSISLVDFYPGASLYMAMLSPSDWPPVKNRHLQAR